MKRSQAIKLISYRVDVARLLPDKPTTEIAEMIMLEVENILLMERSEGWEEE